MKKVLTALVAVVIVVAAAGGMLIRRPLPTITSHLTVATQSQIPGTLNLTMPSEGQAAVEVQGVGLMASTVPAGADSTAGAGTAAGSGTSAANSNGSDGSAIPTGSVAKIMTAYLVLKRHPLKPGASGPTYTITKQDVETYEHDVAIGDSVVKVVAGDKWTEKQMLEGLMLPSGDNMATTLAQWMDGSEPAFVEDMNQTAKALGMNDTNYADASGLSPDTKSTATDLLKLADVAMRDRIFREIVAMPQAKLPGSGAPVYNFDFYVGHYGIVGVKTGSTSHAGGCFVSAMYDPVATGQAAGTDGAGSGGSGNAAAGAGAQGAGTRGQGGGTQQVLLLGAVLGQRTDPIIMSALKASRTMLDSAKGQVKSYTLPQGTPVGEVDVPWQGKVALKTAKPVSYLGFPGLKVTRQLVAKGTGKGSALGGTAGSADASGSSGAQAGAGAQSRDQAGAGGTRYVLQVTAGQQTFEVPLVLAQPIEPPSLRWRLFR